MWKVISKLKAKFKPRPKAVPPPKMSESEALQLRIAINKENLDRAKRDRGYPVLHDSPEAEVKGTEEREESKQTERTKQKKRTKKTEKTKRRPPSLRTIGECSEVSSARLPLPLSHKDSTHTTAVATTPECTTLEPLSLPGPVVAGPSRTRNETVLIVKHTTTCGLWKPLPETPPCTPTLELGSLSSSSVSSISPLPSPISPLPVPGLQSERYFIPPTAAYLEALELSDDELEAQHDGYKTDEYKTDEYKTDEYKTDEYKTDRHKTKKNRIDEHEINKRKVGKDTAGIHKTNDHKADENNGHVERYVFDEHGKLSERARSNNAPLNITQHRAQALHRLESTPDLTTIRLATQASTGGLFHLLAQPAVKAQIQTQLRRSSHHRNRTSTHRHSQCREQTSRDQPLSTQPHRSRYRTYFNNLRAKANPPPNPPPKSGYEPDSESDTATTIKTVKTSKTKTSSGFWLPLLDTLPHPSPSPVTVSPRYSVLVDAQCYHGTVFDHIPDPSSSSEARRGARAKAVDVLQRGRGKRTGLGQGKGRQQVEDWFLERGGRDGGDDGDGEVKGEGGSGIGLGLNLGKEIETFQVVGVEKKGGKREGRVWTVVEDRWSEDSEVEDDDEDDGGQGKEGVEGMVDGERWERVRGGGDKGVVWTWR